MPEGVEVIPATSPTLTEKRASALIHQHVLKNQSQHFDLYFVDATKDADLLLTSAHSGATAELGTGYARAKIMLRYDPATTTAEIIKSPNGKVRIYLDKQLLSNHEALIKAVKHEVAEITYLFPELGGKVPYVPSAFVEAHRRGEAAEKASEIPTLLKLFEK